MARQFKGYAQKKGFAAPDPGYASLSRMKERDNETISRIQERHNQELKRDANYINDLNEVNQIEKSNRDENFAYSQELDENRRDQEQFVENQRREKAEQKLKKINDEALAAAQARNDLGVFSKKLLELGTKVLSDRAIAKEQADEVLAILKGPLELLDPDREMEDALDKTYVAGEEARREAGLNGVSQGTVQSARNASPYLAIGNLNVRMRGAIEELNSMNNMSDHNIQIADIMTKYGLYGVKPNKLHDFAIAARSQISALSKSYDKNLAINQSTQVEQQMLQDVTSTRSADSINKMFSTYLNGTEDGINPRTRTQALDKVFGDEGLFANTALIGDLELDKMLSQPIPDGDGRSWAERFPGRTLALMQQRVTTTKEFRDSLEQQTLNEQNKNADQIKGLILGTEKGFDFQQFKSALATADVGDTHRTMLTELAFDRSQQGVLQDSLIDSIEYKWSTGQDITDDVRMLRGDKRIEWEGKLSNQAKEFNQLGESAADLKKKYTAVAKTKLTQGKIVDADQSYVTAGEEAYRRYVGYYRGHLKDNNNVSEAHRLAEKQILEEIASPSGDFATVEVANQPNKFSFFSPGGGYYNVRTNLTASQLSNVISADRAVLDRELVIPREVAENLYNSVKEGRPYRMPYQLANLQKTVGYEAVRGLQKQLDVLTKENPEAFPQIEVPKTYKEVVSTYSPDNRVKSVIQLVQQQNANSNLQAALMFNPLNFRRPAFMSPRVGASFQTFKNNAIMQPLRDLTMSGEGGFTSGNRGVAGDSPDGVPGLDRKTIGEWKQLYQQGWNALGAFQFIGSTFNGSISRLGLSDDTVMSEDVQYQLFDELMLGGVKRPRLSAYLNGQSNDLKGAAEDFSLEFASAANPNTGITSYPGVGGNAASIGSNDVMTLLQQIRQQRMGTN